MIQIEPSKIEKPWDIYVAKGRKLNIHFRGFEGKIEIDTTGQSPAVIINASSTPESKSKDETYSFGIPKAVVEDEHGFESN